MLAKNILKYTFILLFSSNIAHAGADTGAKATKPPDTVIIPRQITFSADLVSPCYGLFTTNRTGFEIGVDYYARKERYWALEAGAGSSTVAYPDLSYTCRNQFVRIGIQKMMFAPQNANDRDGLFMGLRLAGTTIQRSQAYYSITDSVWGTTTGTVDAKNLKGFWLELVPGIRVSPYKHFFMGWTVRAKFLFNPKDLSELAPLYIAGYGKGDKNAVFDINFYISYALFYHTKRIR